MLKLLARQKVALRLQTLQNMNWLQFTLASYLLLFIAFTASASDNWISEQATAQYSLPPSAPITDLTITTSLGLTQLLIPLNKDSQRLFPDEVNSLDRSMRDKWHTKSDNFLNGTVGSLYTPVSAGVAIIGLNLFEGASLQKVRNQLFIFVNGALANKFLTRSIKYTFSRRRPLLEFADAADKARLDARDKSHESFYSGHASTASFSAAFLRRRISQSLKQHGHASIRSGYQWLTTASLYSWAAYVGYSRVQIDKHYFTDVAVGMIMGLLFEETYYRFNERHWGSYPSWRLTPQAKSGSFLLCLEKRFP